jgi:hypothetical protein
MRPPHVTRLYSVYKGQWMDMWYLVLSCGSSSVFGPILLVLREGKMMIKWWILETRASWSTKISEFIFYQPPWFFIGSMCFVPESTAAVVLCTGNQRANSSLFTRQLPKANSFAYLISHYIPNSWRGSSRCDRLHSTGRGSKKRQHCLLFSTRRHQLL